MEIIRQAQDTDPDKWRDWHILTVAESGFSALEFMDNKLLIDFHVSSAPVPEPYLAAVEEVFKDNSKCGGSIP